MHQKQFLVWFVLLTRVIFTVLTAEGMYILGSAFALWEGTAPFLPLYYLIPRMTEVLAAGILLYTVMAVASAFALREYGT